MTARIERPLSPHLQTYRWTLAMALSPDDSKAYVSNFGLLEIYVVDLQTLKVTTTIPISGLGGVEALSVTPSDHYLLATDGSVSTKLGAVDFSEIRNWVDGQTDRAPRDR